ncbi:PaaI family thioesterase [Rhodomicrobium sp. Az07]|uniref:PaaI family thioesterase n=1 Tax=Rhodomicrobium sp. Az07 TaxID=2839034 RepID=UPI001BECFE77|nr:PaaI family thioesterase [Rhodomicrobium sp. Az07]MBT3071096.1 PaaI family thioesterase [Rhodomicrobium sp. Az07]
MTAADVNAFLVQVFPQVAMGRSYKVEETRHGFARMRMVYGDHLLRPGGTISGPAMFTLADVAMYAAVLASIGPVALAVTTSLTINFLRKPEPRDMIGEARILKLGKRLAVGEIALHSEGESELAAHATATYSVPPH